MNETLYVTKGGFKIGCWILAVVCGVLVVMLPFSIMLLYLAHKAYVKTSDEILEIKWFGTRKVRWDNIDSWYWAPAQGVVGAMMRPLGYRLKDPPKKAAQFALGVFTPADPDRLSDVDPGKQLLEDVQQRSGLQIGK